MATTSPNTRLENQILHFSKQKKWDKVESLWPQLVDDLSANPKFYAILAASMVKQEKAEDLRAWVMLLVEACQTLEDNRTLIQVARGVLRALPEFEELRDPLVSALRVHYNSDPRTEEYIEVSGLGREDGLDAPLRKFLQYVKCAENEVFQHVEWGEGVVERLDLDVGRVHLRFTKGGSKSFSFSGVNEFLKKMPRSHLFAQRLLAPERLATRAQEQPVAFLKYCLKCLGAGASRAELKDNLTVGVFDTRQWNLWWAKNRDLFRFDPYIAFSGSMGNARLELRSEPKSFHEEILKEFRQAEVFSREYALLSDVLKVRETQPVPEDVASGLIAALDAKYRQCEDGAVARRIEYLYLMQDLRDGLGATSTALDGVSTDALILSTDNPGETVCSLSIPDNQMRAARQLKASHAERWPEVAEELFLAAPTRLGQWVLRDAIDEGQLAMASHMAEQLLHRPYENPDLFLWLVRAARDGKLPELEIDVPAELLLSAVLEVIDEASRRIGLEDGDSTRLRGLITRLQNFLMEHHFAVMIDVFEACEPDDARRRYQALMDNNALTEGFKVALDQILRSIRRDLDEEGSAAGGVPREHLVTAASFEARQAVFQDI